MCFEKVLKCNCCLKATLSVVCTWIVSNQVFTESIWVLKLQQKRPELPFVYLSNSFTTRSKIIRSRVYAVEILPNVHNFAGPMQRTNRLIYFLLEDIVQYLTLLQMKLMTASLTLILCTIKLISHHFLYYLQTILSLFC